VVHGTVEGCALPSCCPKNQLADVISSNACYVLLLVMWRYLMPAACLLTAWPAIPVPTGKQYNEIIRSFIFFITSL
jgi:hypothetical protein